MSIRHIAGLVRDMIVSAVKPVSGFRRIFIYPCFRRKYGCHPAGEAGFGLLGRNQTEMPAPLGAFNGIFSLAYIPYSEGMWDAAQPVGTQAHGKSLREGLGYMAGPMRGPATSGEAGFNIRMDDINAR